jgi:hypothetical protein
VFLLSLAAWDFMPVAIYEDDVVFINDVGVVEKCFEQLPEDWDALWLGATVMVPIERYSDNLFRLKEGLCAHAIIYNSQRIVDYIRNNYDQFARTTDKRQTIDVFYAYELQQMFNCFIVSPLVAIQREGYSDIENREINYTQITELFKVNARSSE